MTGASQRSRWRRTPRHGSSAASRCVSSPAALLFALFPALLFLTALLGLLPIPNLIDRLMEYVAQALPMDAASREGVGEVTPMAVERMRTGTNQVEVLDRVLDKGIVIDARLRVALAGVDLVGIDARVVVASLETYRKYEEVNFLERLLRV